MAVVIISAAGFLLGVRVQGQAWIELDDAPSFPDGQAQITRGEGVLTAITGATTGSISGNDLRDAYCVRITDPNSFLATTDPAIDPGASTDNDTRLFLFRPDGGPVLANEDTPPSRGSYVPSTLTGVATDGSGFQLMQPAEYVLIVSARSDIPEDAANVDLFRINTDNDAVHTPNPTAGHFDHWGVNGGIAPSVDYTIVLRGVEFCQGKLDAVFGNFFSFDVVQEQACLGDGTGGFNCSNVSEDEVDSEDVALGYIDGDQNLDAVMAVKDARNQVCLGDGKGGFTCGDVSIREDDTRDVELGYIDDDQHLDIVFANISDQRDRVCLGNGTGVFACSNVTADFQGTLSVALGFIDDDRNLDAYFAVIGAGNFSHRICHGNGVGGFTCSATRYETCFNCLSGDVALGFIDADQHLDVFLAGRNETICLGDGAGDFWPCTEFNQASESANGVALGFLDSDPHLDAALANNGGSPEICYGDGGGIFNCSELSLEGVNRSEIDLGLVDGDRNLDLVFAVGGANTPPNRICFGDGNRNFTCGDVSDTESDTKGVALGDLNVSLIFPDGFESGDTSSWSGSNP